MKRIYTLIVLLGLVVGTMVTGCNQGGDTTADDTNAVPVAPESAPATNQ